MLPGRLRTPAQNAVSFPCLARSALSSNTALFAGKPKVMSVFCLCHSSDKIKRKNSHAPCLFSLLVDIAKLEEMLRKLPLPLFVGKPLKTKSSPK
jgi:hypothetical protein